MAIEGKNINWGNVVKAVIAAGLSLVGVWVYYRMIVKPYVIKLANAEGFSYVIQFNKDFIVNNPVGAILNAIPLFLAIFFAVLAYKYVRKIWNE